ncbi:MAG TPA: alanine--glyoxylate aminotransferase family protein, partial [Gemmatimonadaceae bacterium]
ERPLPVHTTGRGAMEAAICNLLNPGDEIVACCNGKFGELWGKLAESYRIVVHRVATDWNHDVRPADVARALHDHPKSRAVTMTFGDTSTGVLNDVAAVCAVAREHDALVLVDGVSSIGGMPFAFDAWGVDAAVVATQKCLMSAPGLSFVAMSDRAWAANGRATIPRNYWDFAAIRKSVTKLRPDTPGTPPVHIILQVAEALRMMHEEGLDAVYRRHQQMADLARRGVTQLGCTVQCPQLRQRSTALTAVVPPAGVAPQAIRAELKSRGILTAAGLGDFETSAFRIGHMGDIRPADVQRTLDALADALHALTLGTKRA